MSLFSRFFGPSKQEQFLAWYEESGESDRDTLLAAAYEYWEREIYRK